MLTVGAPVSLALIGCDSPLKDGRLSTGDALPSPPWEKGAVV
jgi:hypothetical protein